ncbi:hypothetical protein [Haloferax sp. YSMS24]|uniref:hypothetical protein n=1 Tax=Haloferax sp. YSMS24 TaxID=3388425 RepID=UPI00398CCDE9
MPSCPWADDPRANAKVDLLKYTVEHPEGAPIVVATRAVLNHDADAGDADHRLALRFYRDNPSLFKTDKQDGLVWVWPRTSAFTCTANKHSPKHGGRDGLGDDTAETADWDVDEEKRRPKTNARSALGQCQVIERDGVRGYLLDALATYRETTADRYHRLDRVRGDGPDTLMVPYSTRFNSHRRVRDARERFGGALDRAARRYDRAVLVTLTTDPSRFDSLGAATTSLMGDVSRFKSWLATDGRLGSRPPSVVVPEFTDAGVPHAHVFLFGVSWVVPHAALSAYWSATRERGEVVWFDRLESRGEGGRWRWAGDSPEDAVGRSPRSYLSKMLDVLDEFASASPEDVREAARGLRRRVGGDNREEMPDGVSGPKRGGGGTVTADLPSGEPGTDTGALDCGRVWWKMALYWATGTRLFTLSPSLKASDDMDTLPHVPRYRYVGTARIGEFPGYVWERVTVLFRDGRPPPAPLHG